MSGVSDYALLTDGLTYRYTKCQPRSPLDILLEYILEVCLSVYALTITIYQLPGLRIVVFRRRYSDSELR